LNLIYGLNGATGIAARVDQSSYHPPIKLIWWVNDGWLLQSTERASAERSVAFQSNFISMIRRIPLHQQLRFNESSYHSVLHFVIMFHYYKLRLKLDEEMSLETGQLVGSGRRLKPILAQFPPIGLQDRSKVGSFFPVKLHLKVSFESALMKSLRATDILPFLAFRISGFKIQIYKRLLHATAAH